MFFKIFNNLIPLYLTDNIECKVGTFKLRNQKDIMVVPLKCRLACYKSSFFPDVINEWNKLTCDVTNVHDLKLFKTVLSGYIYQNSIKFTPCPMFKFSYGFYGRVLIQIKLGLSKLNQHLFLYNITDNPFCPNCLDSIEDTKHYFFKCHVYRNARAILQTSLDSVLIKINIVNNSDNRKLEIMLNGLDEASTSRKLFQTVNKDIFNVIKSYIIATARFAK